jgi:hypothetical protein
MLERDYLVTYYLSMESQQRLYRKAENARLAKDLSANKRFKGTGTMGAAVVILVLILFM